MSYSTFFIYNSALPSRKLADSLCNNSNIVVAFAENQFDSIEACLHRGSHLATDEAECLIASIDLKFVEAS